MTPGDEGAWFKSSLSAAEDCVEVRKTRDGVDVRHSRRPHDSVVSFSRSEWRAFVDGVRLGEFDLDRPTDGAD